MYLNLIIIALMVYVIFSLSTIKHQLKLIIKHLNIKDGDIEMVSNEEIEKVLEDELKR